MTAAGPWSVKGIDPKAREIAKDLARRSGMTLGEWLNQMIIDGGEPEAAAEPAPSASDRAYHAPAPERPSAFQDLHRETFARRPVEGYLRESPPRPASGPELARPRLRDLDARLAEQAELARVSGALETLSQRLEAAEHRSTLAISGIDQSVMGVLSRFEDAERHQAGLASRVEGALDEVREAQVQLADRVRQVERGEGARDEGLRALEASLGKIAVQMHDHDARARASVDDVRDAQARIIERLRHMEDRETIHAQSAQELEASFGQLASELKQVEGRAQAAADGVAADLRALAGRVQQAETAIEGSHAAFADADLVETVLTRMADRLDQAETRTSAAVKSLEASFAGLDARLRAAESRSEPALATEFEGRFERLAEELTQKIDQSRTDLAQSLRAAASDPRVDSLEKALRDMAGQVEAAEKRSAKAIDHMGREVTRIAQTLGERVSSLGEKVGAVETRSAAAVEQMSGEMARIADAMETRARKADSVQAQALEKLGGEIARIAERLSERIASAERRSAEANEVMAGQVVEIGDKIAKRHDQTQSELADRIRQSEERTAKLLEEARARIDQKLAEAAPRPVPPPPPAAASPAADVESLLPPSLRQASAPASNAPESAPKAAPPVFAPEPEEPDSPPEPPRRRFGADSFKAAASAKPASTFAADEVVDPFGDDPFAAAEATFPSEPSPFDPSDDFALPPPPASTEPPEDLAPEPPLAAAPRTGFSVRDFAPTSEASGSTSTRSLIEAARAAARQASQGGGEPRARRSADALPPSTPPAAELEPAEEPAPNRPFGINFPKRKKKDAGPTLRTMVLASGTAAALTMAAVGTALIYAPQDHAGGSHAKPSSDDRPVPEADLTPSASPYGQKSPDSTTRAAEPADATLAVALTPAAGAPPAGESPRVLFTTAASRIEHGDRSGVADLRHAANLGYAPAQVYLAELYQAGSAGLPKDMAEARRWTERAAQSGDAHAMYNLASYDYNGEGGPKDPAAAATWFRKAAELGVVNSQYNLAQLYEKGYGVPQNLAEAYKWYLVAAAAGDAESRAAAASLKGQLTPEARAAAERSAASLHLRADPALHASASSQALR